MFAILAYVVEESVFGSSILRETPALLSELGNVRGLEADLAGGVAGLEKGSSSVLTELGNVPQLESDLATLSVKAEAFDKSAINELERDIKGSFLENIQKEVGEPDGQLPTRPRKQTCEHPMELK